MGSRSFFIAAALTGLSLIAFGCSSASSPPEDGGPELPPLSADADLDDGGTMPDVQARVTKPAQGSPLCNASHWMGCYPDDSKSANAQDCNLAPDGGRYNPMAGYDNAQLGCHVARAPGDVGVAPICTPAGAGTDGMPCSDGTDCAPTFECVADGTCRRYCCGGQCPSPTGSQSANSGSFCDIQTTADSALKVPVCIPLRHCNLLDTTGSGTCPTGTTCAVVRDNGATSCVATGPRQAGDGCDTDHCARGLTCLGNLGDRMCFALCHTASRNSECPPGQSCTGGLPLFPIPDVGICK
jgi:hypothetical protein